LQTIFETKTYNTYGKETIFTVVSHAAGDGDGTEEV
jgi:hypothetical protein